MPFHFVHSKASQILGNKLNVLVLFFEEEFFQKVNKNLSETGHILVSFSFLKLGHISKVHLADIPKLENVLRLTIKRQRGEEEMPWQ